MTRLVYLSIRAHGEESYPLESCGVLLGASTPKGWQAIAAVRASNARTDSAHDRYSIAPLELVRIERDARRQGLEIVGFYHSHPDHPPLWSATDFADAHWLHYSYVITEVHKGKAAVTNAFLLTGSSEEEKRFEQQTIEVEECSQDQRPSQVSKH